MLVHWEISLSVAFPAHSTSLLYRITELTPVGGSASLNPSGMVLVSYLHKENQAWECSGLLTPWFSVQMLVVVVCGESE